MDVKQPFCVFPFLHLKKKNKKTHRLSYIIYQLKRLHITICCDLHVFGTFLFVDRNMT